MQERIRTVLEDEIVSGHRPPGSAIDEKALALSFNASRTPVREALLMLAATGLVRIAPRAGIFVRQSSAAELVSTLEALSELEASLARLAAKRAGTDACAALQAACAKATHCAETADRSGYEAANAVLHEAIYRTAANAVLVDHVRGVRKRLAAYRQRGFDKPGRLLTSAREHQTIVDAICRGDATAAADAMRIHIDVGGEAMVQLVLASGATPEPEPALDRPPAIAAKPAPAGKKTAPAKAVKALPSGQRAAPSRAKRPGAARVR